MKTTVFKSLVSLAMGALMGVGMVACSPDTPSNENRNKLHEDPIRAVFTLQEGTLDNNKKFDSQPHMADFKASTAPIQTIEWKTTPNEGWHVVGSNNKFKVKNSQDNPNIVYLLKIQYYNAKDEPMNDQFFNLGQDKIHQHFFSMYKQVEIDGKKATVRVNNKAELPYDYCYADELNGQYVGNTNPMGFQGFIRFVKPAANFTLSIDLLHAAGSKFDTDNKPSPFYLPSKVLLSTGQWDINVKLPVETDGTAQTPSNKLDPTLIQPAKVTIDIYEGHLHGTYAFHQNPKPKENKYIGKNYHLVYHLKDGQWIADPQNVKMVSIVGDATRHRVSAFAIHYYDAQGNDISNQLIDNGEDKHYQHFFVAKDIKPGYGGQQEATDKNGTDFCDYLYCDTDPWNKTNKFDKAEFIGQKNPIGLKGYFFFPHTHKKFIMDIQLMRARTSKFTNGKSSSFCMPSKSQQQQEAWMPGIQIPMNIYMDNAEKELDANLLAASPAEMGTDENKYSKKDRLTIHSLMEAFELTDFKTAVAEFWWNLNGDSKEDNSGFWF